MMDTIYHKIIASNVEIIVKHANRLRFVQNVQLKEQLQIQMENAQFVNQDIMSKMVNVFQNVEMEFKLLKRNAI